MGEVKKVAVSLVRDNPIALRTCDRTREDYLGLVDSMKQQGFLGAVTVRKKKDEETGQTFYELIDGLHRLNAAKDAGLAEINIDIATMSDVEVLEAQLMANVHKVETKPAEYSQQLSRILANNMMVTEAELAKRLGKSPAWIAQRLGLNKIQNPEIVKLINTGKINLSNAYALARLPEDERADFVDEAMTLPPNEFVPKVQARVKELNEAKRKGKDAAPKSFAPVAYMQSAKAIKDDLENLEIAKHLIAVVKPSNTEAAFALALQWVLRLDPESVKVQQAKWDEKEAAKAAKKVESDAKKAAKTAEKAKKAADEAATAAAKAKAVLEGEEPLKVVPPAPAPAKK